MAIFSRWLILLPGFLALAVPLGCERNEPIEHYTVAKPLPIEAPAGVQTPVVGEPKDRTLAAIVPLGSQAWFFKLTGPKDAVAAKTEDFATFLKSVHFSDEGKPEWTLPEGWSQQAGSDIRYATLLIPGEADVPGKPLELTVITLPKAQADDANYTLININRWRGQLQMPLISKEQLAEQTTQVELAGATATMVDLLGTASGKSMGGPFSGGGGPFSSGGERGK